MPSDEPLCPSASPTWPGARVFGVIGGDAATPRVRYLDDLVPASEDLLAATAPVDPGEVLRIAASCAASRCQHFRDSQCGLATNLVQLLPTVTTDLPFCRIRAHCVWFQQEGRAACMRCPQVVTQQASSDPLLLQAVQTR
jgi:hypothetical protein